MEEEKEDKKTYLNIYGTVSESIVDGPGIRFAIFVQGCSHNCPGCHNPQTHEFGAGECMTVEEIVSKIPKENPLLKGVTISGGDPFDQPDSMLELVKQLKKEGYNIWIYSGYVYEQLLADNTKKQILDFCDVLVDGPFIQSLYSPDLEWRGSSNQRIIELPSVGK